jgi:hypothetical protein
MITKNSSAINPLAHRSELGDQRELAELFEQHRQRLTQMVRLRMEQRPSVQRNFLTRVAHLHAQVLSVQVDEFLTGQKPHPQIERHRRILLIVRVPFGTLQVCLLKHVASSVSLGGSALGQAHVGESGGNPG